MATATVHIWNFVHGMGGPFGAGHGSLGITTNGGIEYYITWLAGSGSNNFLKKQPVSNHLGFRKRKPNKQDLYDIYGKNTLNTMDAMRGRQYDNEFRLRTKTVVEEEQYQAKEAGPGQYVSYWTDIEVYGHPHFILKIPCQEKNNWGNHVPYDVWGLKAGCIENWWKKVLSLPPNHAFRHYSLLSKKNNCDGITVQALLAGGLYAYGLPPMNLIFQGTNPLRRWCETAMFDIPKINAVHRGIRGLLILPQNYHAVTALQSRYGSAANVQMPQLREWKHDSYVSFGRRKEQVANIDKDLSLYHQATTNSARLRALREIEIQIYDHLRLKPKSDRRIAVMRLAAVTVSKAETLLKQAPDMEPFE